MNDISRISNVLLAFYDAAYLEKDWVRALDAVCDASHAKGVMVYAEDQTGLLYNVGFSNSLYADKAAEISEYNERFVSNCETSHEQNGMEFISNQPAFAPVLDTDIWPLSYLRSEPSVLFAKQRIGVFRRLCFNLSGTPDLQSGLILQYGTEVADPPRADIETMPLLMPHVGKAIATSRFFSPLRQRYNAVLSVLNNLNLGVCVLDRNGRVVVANTFATELLDQKDGLYVSPKGNIRCREDEETAVLEAALQQIAQTAEGKNTNSEMRLLVTRPGHSDPVLLIASPLRDSMGEIDRNLSGAMLTLVDTARVPRIDMVAFAKAYRLTPAETEVAKLMLDGRSATGIAERRNVSPNTAATQVKSVLAKVGVRSRVQFVWRVFQFSPPVI
jgi:DNA-binding CsgD family transcriptional regulator